MFRFLRFIIRFIPAFIIVWIFRNVLNEVLPIPTDAMVYGLIDLKNPASLQILFGVRLLIWTWLAFLLLKSIPHS
jgi:hypothetical protein